MVRKHGEGPSRGLLRDYEPSDGTFSSTSIYHVSICISCVQVTASNNAIIPEPREMGLKIFPAWKMFIEWRSAGQRGARGAASESNANIS